MEYITNYNGGKYYKVNVDDLHVKVTNLNTNEIVFENDVEKVFIGNDEDDDDEWEGNTFLLKLKDNKYMSIVDEVYTFDAFNEITKYYSPIGNSAVPYPYAIDDDGNYYLTIEDVMVKDIPDDCTDPYRHYYYKGRMDGAAKEIESARINNNKWIEENGESSVMLTYCSNPGKDYDRMDAWEEANLDIEVEYQNGTVKKLSREGYIELMEEYGNSNGFHSIKNKTILDVFDE